MMLCFQTTVLEVGDGCILMMPKVNKKSSFVWLGKRRRLASLMIEPGRWRKHKTSLSLSQQSQQNKAAWIVAANRDRLSVLTA